MQHGGIIHMKMSVCYTLTAIRHTVYLTNLCFSVISFLACLVGNIQRSTWAPPVLHTSLLQPQVIQCWTPLNVSEKSSAYSILGTDSISLWVDGGGRRCLSTFPAVCSALSLTVSSDCVIWRTSVTQTSHLLIHIKLHTVRVITSSQNTVKMQCL